MTDPTTWVRPAPKPAHDSEALFATRYVLRDAWTSIRRLRQADPSIRETLDRLDAMCAELTYELEDNEPSLPLPRVIVAVGVDRSIR